MGGVWWVDYGGSDAVGRSDVVGRMCLFGNRVGCGESDVVVGRM
jgi:hypothetical protein